MNVLAVDVGTTSVRLAIISFQGDKYQKANILASREKEIGHYQDGVKFEQSSKEIWSAICECSKYCIQTANVNAQTIKSIAFSATCSLVIHNESSDSNNVRDIIMWMDHRAMEEAKAVTDGGSKVLEQFGGICSPEFSLSKLLWLKNNDLRRLETADGLFELPDWLVYRCIGGETNEVPRSTCCVTCKWGYDAELDSHCDILQSFDDSIKCKFGRKIIKPGTIAGHLSSEAAKELGILCASGDISNKENRPSQNIVVGTSLIDAHSGMLAMLSVPLKTYGVDELTIESTFCSLAGTSSCHMLLSKTRNFTRGIWGPYKDVVLDQYHLLEAGQSLTGKLIEICIQSSEEGKSLLASGKSMKEIIGALNASVDVKQYASDLHVLPTYHGNRSPLANPRLKGGIYGLKAESQVSLREQYIATIESIVFELKFIVETLQIKLSAILVSGGLMKNGLLMQILADVLECKVVKMSLENVDFMVMGSGLVARCAALNATNEMPSRNQSVGKPLTSQSVEGMEYDQLDIEIYKPNHGQTVYLKKKYSCYREFVDLSQRIDKILMND